MHARRIFGVALAAALSLQGLLGLAAFAEPADPPSSSATPSAAATPGTPTDPATDPSPTEEPAPTDGPTTEPPTTEEPPADEPAPAPEPTPSAAATTAATLPPGNPFGNVESFTLANGTITASGWAIDPDTTSAIIVQMYVDYSSNTMAWADQPRPDVEAYYPDYGPEHGFSLSLAASAGSHSVCVYGINVGEGTTVTLGCSTVVVPSGNPFGSIEAVSVGTGSVTASGWAIDPDTTAPILVQLYLDWSANTAGTADLPRPDVAAAYPGSGDLHGYSLTLPASPGSHTACVYAINTGGGTSQSLGCRMVVVPSGNPFGSIETFTLVDGAVTASGWAIDPDTPDPIVMQMFVDWSANTTSVADASRPDVAAVYPAFGPNHGFSISMPLGAGSHTVCVYAINTGAGSSVQLGCRYFPGDNDCTVLKCIALTFDDGPGSYTPRLLDYLESARVKATFFLVGNRVDSYPTTIRRMKSLGMEVGNHSWDHTDLTTLSSTAITWQLSTTQNAIAGITGARPTVMRPPYGAHTTTSDALAGQQGLAVILWNIDTLDWKYPDPARIRSVVVNNASRGAIVLMHDIHSTTVDAVPGIISDLKARGYTLVTVSELLGSPRPGVVYSRG